jgi:hypothetical protein
MIGCADPPTPEKFRMYHNLVAAPAFLIAIGSSAPPFYNLKIFVIQRSATRKCQLGHYFPAWTPAWTLVASLDPSFDYCISLDRRVLHLDSTTYTY